MCNCMYILNIGFCKWASGIERALSSLHFLHKSDAVNASDALYIQEIP